MAKMKWILRWESVHPFYRMEASFIAHKTKAVLGSDYRSLMGISKNGVMQMYYLQKDLVRKSKESLKIFQNKKQIQDYQSFTNQNSDELIEIIKETNKFIYCLSNQDLAKRYKKIIVHLGILHASYDLSRPEFFKKIEVKIKKYLQLKGVEKAKLNKIFGILATSEKYTLLDREEIDWLEILLKAKKIHQPINEEIIKKLKVHQKKYGWIGTSEQKNPWTLGYYKNLLLEELTLSKKEIDGKLRLKKEKKLELVKKQLQLVHQLKINRDIQYLLEIVKEMSHIRLNIRLKWVESGFLIKGIFEEIAKRFRLNKNELECYSLNEIIALLMRGKKVNSQIIKKRSYYAFILANGCIKFYNGVHAIDALKARKLLLIDYRSINEIRGNVANPGFSVGTVKIINAYSQNQMREASKMEKGQILVTGMTRPHLIYAMRKASAIITDEGGIVSHAAIVSRELGIPCVIGTKIATKVFKDGDLVEVDAEKGVVRKL